MDTLRVRIPDIQTILKYGWHEKENRALTVLEAVRIQKYWRENMANKRRVIGDSPEHARHLIWDSHTNTYAESDGGLAFSVGVAVIECVTVCNPDRFWKVCHSNGVELFVVQWIDTYGTVCVTKVY